jgi:hypothetical protein
MKINAWKVSTLALACMLAGVVATGRIQIASADQPNMTDAKAKLQDARSSLAAAADDKGGHRVKAMGFVDQAIAEVNLGIAAGASHK